MYKLHTDCNIFESVERFVLFTKAYCTQFIFSFIQHLHVVLLDQLHCCTNMELCTKLFVTISMTTGYMNTQITNRYW